MDTKYINIEVALAMFQGFGQQYEICAFDSASTECCVTTESKAIGSPPSEGT